MKKKYKMLMMLLMLVSLALATAAECTRNGITVPDYDYGSSSGRLYKIIACDGNQLYYGLDVCINGAWIPQCDGFCDTYCLPPLVCDVRNIGRYTTVDVTVLGCTYYHITTTTNPYVTSTTNPYVTTTIPPYVTTTIPPYVPPYVTSTTIEPNRCNPGFCLGTSKCVLTSGGYYDWEFDPTCGQTSTTIVGLSCGWGPTQPWALTSQICDGNTILMCTESGFEEIFTCSGNTPYCEMGIQNDQGFATATCSSSNPMSSEKDNTSLYIAVVVAVVIGGWLVMKYKSPKKKKKQSHD